MSYIIHVDAPQIIRNRDKGLNKYVVVVRREHKRDVRIFCREATWEGPSKIVHRWYDPLPGTKGRGVSWIETNGPITLHFDDKPDKTLRRLTK